MMGAFGRFLEVSAPSADVVRSLEFYRALGFAELAVGDIRRWHYAVVSDGQLAIGLHGGGPGEPALAFVRPHLARQVQALEATGHAFEFCELGAEAFHEAALRSPDGQLIWMMEARTWSGSADIDGTLLGRCREVRLGCADVESTRAFLEAAGFQPASEAGDERLRLHLPGLTLALGARRGRATPLLCFDPPDPGALRERLDALGIEARRGADGLEITAPEGTRLLLG
jgi:catechol 2,3-dioxygenase-like lactoylglutathione lyase family enzyme